MAKVLVVDDMAIFRDPIAASLQLAGYKTCCAANGKEALVQVATEKPDLILLDAVMPEMDGLEFLQTLRRDPTTGRIPVILLTAISEKQFVLQVAKSGISDYLLKSRFSMKDLLARVRKYLPAQAATPQAVTDRELRTEAIPKSFDNAELVQRALQHLTPTGSAPPIAIPRGATGGIVSLLTREQCIERAEKALQARTLSGVVAQVLSLTTSPRSDLSDLTGLIARDPVLSARVLQAANSVAYTSSRGTISTLPEAVRNIGCATVRGIAAAVGVFDAMPPSEADGFNPIRSWQHSFAVATLCDRLAPAGEGGLAYLVGLCHDLGEILFYSHFGSEYRQVLEAQHATGTGRDEIERRMLGITHGELVATILRCLELPEDIHRSIASFHEAGISRAATDPLARLLQAADLYANGTLLSSSGHSLLRPLSRLECRRSIGRDDPLSPDAALLRGEIYALTAMFARLSAKEEAKLMSPEYSRRSARIMLVRDPSLSPFDPIAVALESLADVTIRDALPNATELTQYAGIVVTARSTSSAGFSLTDIIKANSANKPLPVLWLTARIDGASTVDGAPVAPVLWPVPLSRIAEFIRKL